jgi:hypothetical protein
MDWTFVIFAVKMNDDGFSSTVNFKVNGVTADDEFAFSSGHYYIETGAGYPSYIGGYRTGTTTWAETFKGFIWNMYVDNSYLTGTASTYWITQTCDSSCGTGAACSVLVTTCLEEVDIDKQQDGTTDCGTKCTEGCRYAGDCVTACLGSYCHLCEDVECQSCTGYGTSVCNSASCTASNNAAYNAGACDCKTGYTRGPVTVQCTNTCHTLCATCVTGG